MENINLKTIEALTVEDVNRLVIHSTRSSIRRAGSVKPMVVVNATEKVPTLYYIKEGADTWSIHALSSDLTRFLLLQSVGTDSTTEE